MAVFSKLTPAMLPVEVSAAPTHEQIVLVDVREAAEYATERIRGALHHPLSSFDSDALPRVHNRPIVFYCLSGTRSAKAYHAAATAGVPLCGHMSGGISA